MTVELLSVRQAARMLNRGKTQLYVMAREGKIPTVDVGGVLRIPRAELELWIDQNTRRASASGEPAPEPPPLTEAERAAAKAAIRARWEAEQQRIAREMAAGGPIQGAGGWQLLPGKPLSGG